MEFLQAKLGQLRTTLEGMSGSGRLALAMAALLVVALLVIVSHNVGEPELVALPTSGGPAELTRAAGALTGAGIKNEVRGNQIFVSPDRVRAGLEILVKSDAVPESGVNFAELIKDSSPWSTDQEQQKKWNFALKGELESLIRAMPGIGHASVNINYGTGGTLRRVPEGASASVAVKTGKGSPLTRETARSIALLVAGAVNGLSIDKINVIDQTTGKSLTVQSDDGAGDYVPLVTQYENYFDQRLRDHFSYIHNAMITVHCVPNLEKTAETSHKVDPKEVINGETQERTLTSTGAGSGSGPVGVTPNVGTPVAGSGASASGESSTDEKNGHPVAWSWKQTATEKGRGEVKEMTVSINVPRSYFESIERSKAGDAGAKIDEAKLQTTMTAEMAKIADQAKTMIGAKDDTSVKVSWFYDLKDDKVEETGSSFKDGLLASLSGWGPSAGLGLLALLALGLVWNVVKKIQPVAAPPETVTVASENMTEGLTLDSILEGVELEADTIRASKMQEQIASMVKEDPESVANLVKRWIVQE